MGRRQPMKTCTGRALDLVLKEAMAQPDPKTWLTGLLDQALWEYRNASKQAVIAEGLMRLYESALIDWMRRNPPPRLRAVEREDK